MGVKIGLPVDRNVLRPNVAKSPGYRTSLTLSRAFTRRRGALILQANKKQNSATLLPMATRPKLTPVQVLERLQLRLEKRMESLQRVKLGGFEIVIGELEVELDYLRRATRYLEEKNQHENTAC
jgi:hypothetical protein